MVKIAVLIEELALSKVKFASVYEKVCGKKLTEKVATISEKNAEEIKNEVKRGLKETKDPSKREKESPGKVFRVWSLQQSNSFFSGLWFAEKKEEKQEAQNAKQEEKIEVAKQEEKEEKKEDFFSQATTMAKNKPSVNAKVIRREPEKEVRQEPKRTDQGRQPRKWPEKKAKDNIAFGEGKLRPEKVKPPLIKHVQATDLQEVARAKRAAQPQPVRSTQSSRWERRSPTQGSVKTPVVVSLTPKKIKEAKTSSTLSKKTEIMIGKTITVKELSEKMGVPVIEIMKVMLQNKILWWITTAIDFDTAALLASDFDVQVNRWQEAVSLENILGGNLQSILDADKESPTSEERPPIVTVMGHVDHGKTSLLDYLRKTNIAGGEAGGITQSIGASMIEYNGKKITFIDTPGHELFTSLRARGAKLTNIVILIIAADDGIKPQTVESINHAKEAGVPIVIAVTKIDKVGDRSSILEKIKSDVGTYGLIPEDRWGDVPIIPVSSKTGEGIPALLEHILLQAEVLELKYNPARNAVGVVVDANKDAKQGITTSLIILTGTLREGDIIVVHNTYGKVRRMINGAHKQVKIAKWGEPVMILGLQEVPEPGRVVEVVDKEKEAQQRISKIQEQMSKADAGQSTLQKFLEQKNEGTNAVLKIILKADGPSSLEALQQAIQQIKVPETVEIKTIHSSIGIVTDSDISLAQASDGIVVWFNTKIPAPIKKKADQYKVLVKNYTIIYELIAYIEDVVHGLIKIELKETSIGKLNVLGVFFKKEKTMVIGGKVLEGKAQNGAKFYIWRNDEQIGGGEITSLQKEQDSVKEVAVGHECGMKVKVNKKVEEGDILEFYVMQ